MDNNERKYKIYVYTNKINGKKYVGQTCRTLRERAGKNGKLYKGCAHFNNAIKKYGWDNFEVKVLYDNLTKEKANTLERLMIQILRTQNIDYGYNIDAGGSDNTYNSFDITGQKFGRWTPIVLIKSCDSIGRHWLCRCDCGVEKVIRQCNLLSGSTKSCGCLSREINSKITKNKIEVHDGTVTVFMYKDYKFKIDLETYEKIKDNHFFYDESNKRIVTGKGINIYRLIYPDLKKVGFTRYIKHKNNDVFDLCKSNLFFNYPEDIVCNDFLKYLQDGIKNITLCTKQNKKWIVKDKNAIHSFYTYDEAKNYLIKEVS